MFNFRIFCSVLIFAFTTLPAPITHSCTEMIVIADGGFINDPLLFDREIIFEIKWRDHKLTIKTDQAIGGTTIKGTVKHGYGNGEFKEEIIARAYITDVSISTFSDRISFEVSLSENVPNTLTSLFSVQPVANFPGETGSLNRMHRPGENNTPLTWDSLSVNTAINTY